MGDCLGEHAVVVGGSVAGLMTARVLADHFAQVTVLERDAVSEGPGLHKSIPQGHHVHVLLIGGLQVLSALYPGFAERLTAAGAVRWKPGRDGCYFRPDGKSYTLALGSVREPRDLGIDVYNLSRGPIEHCVRQCTLELANIKLQTECSVQAPVFDKGRVGGVRYDGPGGSRAVEADLVVDASGRGSRAPHWLAEAGFQTPEETTIGVDFAYASTKYRIPKGYDAPERFIGIFGPAPDYPNGAFLGAIENDLWHVSLVGRFGDFPATDEAGFLAFAKALHSPVAHDLMRGAERVTDITSYRYPTSVLRHYERLSGFPEGLLVLGDAICSFNPVYGQGMSVAALQAQMLQQVLAEWATRGDRQTTLAQAFFPKAAEAIAAPWALSSNADLAYPKTKGERPVGSKERAAYLKALGEIVNEDIDVHRLVAEVVGLAKPLSALMEEPLRSRVVGQMQRAASA